METISLQLSGHPVWLSGFRLSDGSSLARQRTQVWISADEHALTVAFLCNDRDPWGTMTRRGDPVWQEECVELFLAPGDSDPTTYFEFEISPLGTLFEARIHNPSGRRADMRADTDWRCEGISWHAALLPEQEAWSADLVIPWASLGLERPLPRIWRANLYRIDRPRDGMPPEFSCWLPTYQTPANFHVPSHFGRWELTPASRRKPAGPPMSEEKAAEMAATVW